MAFNTLGVTSSTLTWHLGWLMWQQSFNDDQLHPLVYDLPLCLPGWHLFSVPLGKHTQKVFECLLENQQFLRLKKLSFTNPSFSYWGSWSPQANWKWTQQKLKQWWNGHLPQTEGSYNALGIDNLYIKFILNYSFEAAPLTALSSSRIPFCWFPEAHRAFLDQKQHFTSAPILTMPDSEMQFSLDADSSDGVRAVLKELQTLCPPEHVCSSFLHLETKQWRNPSVICCWPHSTLLFTGQSRILLCGEEGQVPETL